LLVPVGEVTQLGQALDLVDVAGAQAAAAHLLQGDQVVVAEHGTDALQVAGPARVRQQVLPAAGQVVVVALGADADLDGEAEQAQAPVAATACIRAEGVDLRLAQTCGTPGTPAAQHGGGLSWRNALSGSGSRPPAGSRSGRPRSRRRSGTCR